MCKSSKNEKEIDEIVWRLFEPVVPGEDLSCCGHCSIFFNFDTCVEVIDI